MSVETTNTETPTADRRAGRIRLLGAAMVITLLGQLLLGMANTFWLSLPDSGSGWNVASPALLLTAHMTLGTALLVLSVWILVLAVRLGDRGWVVSSVVGIVALLVSLTGGSLFMGETSNDGASYLMAVGCAVAIAAYALSLYRVPQPPGLTCDRRQHCTHRGALACCQANWAPELTRGLADSPKRST